MSVSLRVALALSILISAFAARLAASEEERPFGDAAALERSALIREVLARNPSIAAADAARRAAEARPLQARALGDPRLAYSVAPRTLASGGGRDAHRIDLAQPLPFPGKRGLREKSARGEAEASRFELATRRLELALSASQLFDDYYLAARSLVVNDAHRALVDDLYQAALARYEAGEVGQQSPLSAELEGARLARRRVELEALQRVVIAELNALLHRPPDAALPPPPESLAPPAFASGDLEAQLEHALAARPELQRADARLRSQDAAVRLARREFFPDLTLMGSYEGAWDVPELRPMVGVEIELPFQLKRRRAALAEAEAMRDERASERNAAEDQVRLGVATAYHRLVEAQEALAIQRDRTLPAAEDQAVAARAAFEAGRENFLVANDAERSFYDAELGLEEALSEASRRSAALERELGRLAGLPREEQP